MKTIAVCHKFRMEEVPKRIRVTTVEEIYRSKERRRKLVAALTIEQKIKIVEKLRDLAKATAPYCKSTGKKWP